MGKILNPGAFFQHERTDGAFEQFGTLANDKQRQDRNACKSAQAECQRHTNTPHKAAVKQEGYHSLTAGPQGKIGGIGVRAEGHDGGIDTNQLGSQLPHFVAGIV